jgi:hypothetical protein
VVEEPDDHGENIVRTGQEVARRLLAVFAVYGRAAGAAQKDVADWLRDNGLTAELTPIESTFLAVGKPSVKERIPRTWDSERIIVLLWALGHISELPPADAQCDTAIFGNHLPPFASVNVTDFINTAKLRPNEELWNMRDALLDLHWHARDGVLNNRPPKMPVTMGIIQERHRAMNWVIGYDRGAAWDDVTTDT